MKKTLRCLNILLLLVFFAVPTQAQKGSLRGQVVNEEQVSVALANVMILDLDSSLVAGTVTDEGGNFLIENLTVKDCLVKIQNMLFNTLVTEMPAAGFGRFNRFTLTARTFELGEVAISGKTPILRREAGKIIFETKSIAGAINSVDLLRYTPGVAIDGDNVSLFGTGGVKFYINGKEQKMGGREMLQLLKSYPASDIERIEVIQNPSAKYAAEGNAGIINLKLKRKENNFVGGSLTYARTQYEEGGNDLNANIIYNKGKVATSLNFSGLWDKSLYRETNVMDFTAMTRDARDDGHLDKHNYSLRWQLDYALSEKVSLGAYAMYADGDRKLGVDGQYDYFSGSDRTTRDSVMLTDMARHEDTKNYTLNLNGNLKLGDKGAAVQYDIDYYRLKMGDDAASRATMGDGTAPLKFSYDNHIAQTVDNYSGKIDLGLPFKDDRLSLGTGLSHTRSDRELNYTTMQLAGVEQRDRFVYDETVWATYADFNKKFSGKLSMGVGMRFEYTWTKGDNKSLSAIRKSHYGKLFPSFYLGYTPNGSHSFNWSFSNRVTRPNILNVNPSMVYQDLYNVLMGNPELSPTYFYKTMMGYTYKGVLSFDLYYAYLPDKINSIAYLNDRKITTRTWGNVVDENEFGLNSFYYFDKVKWLTVILMQGLYYTKTTSDAQWVQPRKESFSYTGTLNAQVFFDKKRKWVSNFNVNYTSRQKDVTKEVDPLYKMDIGLQYTCLKDKLTLGCTCFNLLASKVRGREYVGGTLMHFNNKFNYRMVRLSVTYNWGARLRVRQRSHEADKVSDRVVNDF